MVPWTGIRDRSASGYYTVFTDVRFSDSVCSDPPTDPRRAKLGGFVITLHETTIKATIRPNYYGNHYGNYYRWKTRHYENKNNYGKC